MGVRQQAPQSKKPPVQSKALEGAARQGESPVGEALEALVGELEYRWTREIWREAGGTTLQG